MYLSITKQHLGSTFNASVADFVAYLEKENAEKSSEQAEHFFDQYNDRVAPETVIREIDGNTAKLKKKEPKFYSLTINPTGRELQAIGNDPDKLREYVREVMKDYAASFNRDRTVTVGEIKYYAKIEYDRSYREFDKMVKENSPFMKKITALKNDIRKVERGESEGNLRKMQKQVRQLTASVPHQMNGAPVVPGMKKPGLQTHVHIIVSRKDATNTYSLSPGSLYKASEAILNGKVEKRGFDRDAFFQKAEKTFDRVSGFERNYVERYRARKTFVKDKRRFYKKLMGLPTSEKALAFKMLRETGVKLPYVPTNSAQLAVSTFKKLKRGLELALRSGSIEI